MFLTHVIESNKVYLVHLYAYLPPVLCWCCTGCDACQAAAMWAESPPQAVSGTSA